MSTRKYQRTDHGRQANRESSRRADAIAAEHLRAVDMIIHVHGAYTPLNDWFPGAVYIVTGPKGSGVWWASSTIDDATQKGDEMNGKEQRTETNGVHAHTRAGTV